MRQKSISFTSFNLYNLNEPGQRIYFDSDGWDQKTYQRKLNWTARLLDQMSADVIGFQEAWDIRSLKAARNQSGLADSHKVIAPTDHKGQRIICAALVRKSLLTTAPTWIDRFPDAFRLQNSGSDEQTEAIKVEIDRFSRPVLHFGITPRSSAPEIQVYVCHFKSKRPTDIYRESWYEKSTHSAHRDALGAGLSTIRRTAEAAALRMIITQRTADTNTPVVVLGDFNDGQMSNTLNIMTGQPRYLSPLSKGGGDTDLYSAQTLQQYRSRSDVYYTHIYQDMHESLDHILVSQEFYDNSRKRLWAFDGLEIANDHLEDTDHKKTGTGDHAIIRARFKYKPARN